MFAYVTLPIINGRLVVWIGSLGIESVLLSKIPFHKRTPGIQTTRPQTIDLRLPSDDDSPKNNTDHLTIYSVQKVEPRNHGLNIQTRSAPQWVNFTVITSNIRGSKEKNEVSHENIKPGKGYFTLNHPGDVE